MSWRTVRNVLFFAILASLIAPSILVYPPSGTGALNITYGDLRRLEPGEFLNDTLIEFGLKYVAYDDWRFIKLIVGLGCGWMTFVVGNLNLLIKFMYLALFFIHSCTKRSKSCLMFVHRPNSLLVSKKGIKMYANGHLESIFSRRNILLYLLMKSTSNSFHIFQQFDSYNQFALVLGHNLPCWEDTAKWGKKSDFTDWCGSFTIVWSSFNCSREGGWNSNGCEYYERWKR